MKKFTKSAIIGTFSLAFLFSAAPVTVPQFSNTVSAEPATFL